jgi:hypothetical protein
VVWVVDDLEANHALVRRSMPAGWSSVCNLVSHRSGGEAILEIGLALDTSPEKLPDVVFMDFFLGDGYGNDFTVTIRKAFADRKLAGPYIVGHSSSPPASLEIVKAGGDVAIEKERHAPFSPGVRRLFPDLEAIKAHAGRAIRATGSGA